MARAKVLPARGAAVDGSTQASLLGAGLPFVSVVVRSYKRPGPLVELVGRLLAQDYPHLEVIVVEQSDDPRLVAELAALGDPRLRVVERPAMGPPAARNEGVRHSRGEVLLFIDDDDLPLGSNWVASHAVNYADPACIGVNGRLAPSLDRPAAPRYPRLVRWAAMRHTFFKDPWTFAFGSLRKEGIDFLVGSNASVRRSIVERVGGWDEGIPMGEEQSFAFRLAANRRPGEFLVYDPEPIIWRRVDIPGGLDRRASDGWYVNELMGRIIYYHGVVAHYFPRRFRLLYPLYVLRELEQVLIWLWDPDNAGRSLSERLRASIMTMVRLPTLEWSHGWRLPRERIRRVPVL
jgi:glycosyltransferase involved in cell wall biosynthesis